MRSTGHRPESIDATVVAAADIHGRGVAYARLRSPGGERVVRVPFDLPNEARNVPHAVGYVAATAVAGTLAARGIRRAVFHLDDPDVVDDLNGRRGVPPALVLPYVRLKCALNAFERCGVALASGEDDLRQRARAEVAVNVAA